MVLRISGRVGRRRFEGRPPAPERERGGFLFPPRRGERPGRAFLRVSGVMPFNVFPFGQEIQVFDLE